MDAKNNKQTGEAASPEENPELGIKRVRTYAEDLALAREKAGISETEPEKKKGGLFGGGKKKTKVPTKHKQKIDEKKDLSKTQPEVDMSKAPEAEETSANQPSKDFIERELARSGIVTQSEIEKKQNSTSPKEEESSVPTLRTYKYDTAESIQEKGVSKIKMVAAEEKRRVENKDFSKTFEPNTPESSIGRNITLVVLSLVLVASGIGGGVYFFNKSKVDDTPAIVVSKNILFTNDTVEHDAKGISGRDLVNLISAAADSIKGRADDLIEIELLDRGMFGEAKMSKDTLFKRLEGSASGRLIRSFGDNYVIGAHSGLETTVFYLFKIEDFDTAFAGMLEWEDMMYLNLYGEFEGGEFVDEFIRNKDTRIQRDRLGNVRLIYAFPNSETLIITQNELAFFELFERLTVSNATQN